MLDNKISLKNNFGRWLKNQLEARGWTQTELGERAKIKNPSPISMWITGQGLKRPDLRNCVNIARALDVPWQTVVRQAYPELIPSLPEEAEALEEVIYLWKQLAPSERETALKMLRGLRQG